MTKIKKLDITVTPAHSSSASLPSGTPSTPKSPKTSVAQAVTIESPKESTRAERPARQIEAPTIEQQKAELEQLRKEVEQLKKDNSFLDKVNEIRPGRTSGDFESFLARNNLSRNQICYVLISIRSE